MTVSRAADLYVRTKLARGEFRVESAKKVAGSLRQFTEAVGDKKLRKLDQRDAETWMAATAHLAPSTRRLRWSNLHVWCQWCVDEELMARNIFRKTKPPKPPRRTPRDLPPEAVCATLRKAFQMDGIRGRLIVLLMVQQGLRCGGVASLRIEDIDGRWMRVVEKGDHERTLWITEETWEALEGYLNLCPATEGPLIRAWKPTGEPGRRSGAASDRGLSPGTVSKFVTEWMYEAGVKRSARDGVSPHALRHTCATDMLDQGAAITDVQATLGHVSVSTTMIYTHVRPERLSRAMEGRRYA